VVKITTFKLENVTSKPKSQHNIHKTNNKTTDKMPLNGKKAKQEMIAIDRKISDHNLILLELI
jgi:hypothetical protein